ncbi:DUF1571 domain-containing protein [Paludisphaera sp.]|uniref:DUF1571 domain-containing protein n=1 Tax=Paludisphaera sp. TaxID=2017432 RepID=UPI00301E1549
MLRARSGGPTVTVSRRVPIGSLVKRSSVALLVLALAVAADSPSDGVAVEADARVALTATADVSAKVPVEGPAARAVRIMRECRARFDLVDDYTCTFYKRERIDGHLTEMNVMSMKARNRPHSVYFRFHQPKKGREAIYVEGRNDGYVLAHDVGFFKVLAGTMRLDPRGDRAMEGCRHPVTSAGISHLIDTVLDRWAAELNDEESVVLFDPRMRLGSAPCMLIEAIHPHKRPGFFFHKVRLFIDSKLGIPVRYEAYDWPRTPGDAPELVEEYAYDGIKLNVGLTDADFDPANPQYAFGRF